MSENESKAIDDWLTSQADWTKRQMEAAGIHPPAEGQSWPCQAGYWQGYCIALGQQRLKLEAEVERLKQKLIAKGDLLP